MILFDFHLIVNKVLCGSIKGSFWVCWRMSASKGGKPVDSKLEHAKIDLEHRKLDVEQARVKREMNPDEHTNKMQKLELKRTEAEIRKMELEHKHMELEHRKLELEHQKMQAETQKTATERQRAMFELHRDVFHHLMQLPSAATGYTGDHLARAYGEVIMPPHMKKRPRFADRRDE